MLSTLPLPNATLPSSGWYIITTSLVHPVTIIYGDFGTEGVMIVTGKPPGISYLHCPYLMQPAKPAQNSTSSWSSLQLTYAGFCTEGVMNLPGIATLYPIYTVLILPNATCPQLRVHYHCILCTSCYNLCWLLYRECNHFNWNSLQYILFTLSLPNTTCKAISA